MWIFNSPRNSFWVILTGPIPRSNSSPSNSSFSTHVSFHCEVSLDKQISKFSEVEDLPRKKFMSKPEQICEELYKQATKRDKEGRYVVSLPFREDFPQKMLLGQSRNSTMAQFFRNEGRLVKNSKLKKNMTRNTKRWVI